MHSLDPRTRLFVGIMAVAAVFVARRIGVLFAEFAAIIVLLLLFRLARTWIRSSRLIWPMIVLVFAITALSVDVRTAVLQSVRLFNLFTVSFIFFSEISPEEMGDVLRKLGIPYSVAFILSAGMRYVPLVGQKIRSIMDAQSSRGIDLRLRVRNLANFMALLLPLLAQSFVLSEELAMAMESRGFGRPGRSSRRVYRLARRDYVCMAFLLLLVTALTWWERQ